MKGALLCCAMLCVVMAVRASELEIVGSLAYPEVSGNCSFLEGACAPLSDVWGFERGDRKYALVGVANGVDLVNTTNPKKPTRMRSLVQGCVTEWRDIKVYEDTVYIVNDHTALCQCEEQPCQLQVHATFDGEEHEFQASEGSVGKPLADFPGPVEGNFVMIDTFGCDPGEYGDYPPDTILGVPRGSCTYSTKVKNAQGAGASAVVVMNHRVDIIYPSMAGDNTGVEIPAVVIGKDSADMMNATLQSGGTVFMSLSSTYMVDNPYYSPPDGLIVASIKRQGVIREVYKTREFFDFSHNILVDTERGYLYACGTSPGVGGIYAFSLHDDPEHPQLIGTYNDTYIHDVEIETRPDGTFVLYGCAIGNKTVFVFDVTDPSGDFADKIITSFTTIESPHNSAATQDGAYLYVTHEEPKYPVTVWNTEDLNNIKFVGNISFGAEHGTIPHNAFVNGPNLWMSYYSEGVLVFDTAADPGNPPMIGHADTSPQYDEGFHGVWGIYMVGMDSSNETATCAYASDIENGLFVLDLTSTSSSSSYWWILAACGGALVVIGAAGVALFLYMRHRRVQYFTAEDDVEVL